MKKSLSKYVFAKSRFFFKSSLVAQNTNSTVFFRICFYSLERKYIRYIYIFSIIQIFIIRDYSYINSLEFTMYMLMKSLVLHSNSRIRVFLVLIFISSHSLNNLSTGHISATISYSIHKCSALFCIFDSHKLHLKIFLHH